MSALRASLAETVTLLLAVSLTAAVAAQDEADPMAPAYFTYTTGEPVEFTEGEVTHIDGITTEVRGGGEVGVTFEATDSRASGLATAAFNADAIGSDDNHFTIATTSVRLVNDGGAWSGTGMAVIAFTSAMALGGEIPRTTELTVLTGEGGYEGLTLIISASHDGDSEAQWGVIIPTDGLPPVPDPPEPPEPPEPPTE